MVPDLVQVSDAMVRSLFLRYFQTNTGWTLPALFSILRDLRDLAFDVSSCMHYREYTHSAQADLEVNTKGQEGTANMEEAARIISKAFTNCVMDRYSSYLHNQTTLHAYSLKTITICRISEVGCLLCGRTNP